MESDGAQGVLRDVVNEAVGSLEEDDFALAKLMQEQERALFQARNIIDQGENFLQVHDIAVRANTRSNETVSEATLGEAEDRAIENLEDCTLEDEELARRLDLAEQIQHQRHLMELAGFTMAEGTEYTDEDEGYLTEDSVDPDEMTYEELRALGDAVGVVSRGASVDVIEALPLARYARKDQLESCKEAKSFDLQDEQCVVCRMEFEGGEDVKVLPCKHIFHPECVDQWLVINKACPICSQEVAAEESSAQDNSGSKPHALDQANKTA